MMPLEKRKRVWRFLRFVGIVLVGTALMFTLIRLVLAGYTVDWTGFRDYEVPNSNFVRGKTLWNWLELFIIPIFLAFGAFYLNRSERESERQRAEERSTLEREIATDRQQEAALQAYLDRMADLLLKENLRVSENEELHNVARIRTLTLLRGLDAKRKGMVLLFLYESKLINEQLIIDLTGADLRGVELSGADLSGADLSKANLWAARLPEALLIGANLYWVNLMQSNLMQANLSRADLRGINLIESNLSGAKLSEASLSGGANLSVANLKEANLSRAKLEEASLRGAYLKEANLSRADLSQADLTGAEVSDEQLMTARSLKGAIMPDGTKHD